MTNSTKMPWALRRALRGWGEVDSHPGMTTLASKTDRMISFAMLFRSYLALAALAALAAIAGFGGVSHTPATRGRRSAIA
jgi:hypothetical protein